MKQPKEGYACEPLAGCVYRYRRIRPELARRLAEPSGRPHVVELIVTEPPDRLEHRLHYALDLPQAVAKAAEMATRMRRQGVGVDLCAIRPATDEETEAFFAELVKYDGEATAGSVQRGRP